MVVVLVAIAMVDMVKDDTWCLQELKWESDVIFKNQDVDDLWRISATFLKVAMITVINEGHMNIQDNVN